MKSIEIGTRIQGRSYSFFLHRGGNKDSVPRTGFQWELFWNGQKVNTAFFSTLTVANVPHTLNVNAFGFEFKPEVAGTLRVKGVGHGLTFDETYTVEAESPTSNLQSKLEEALGLLEEVRDGLKSGVVK